MKYTTIVLLVLACVALMAITVSAAPDSNGLQLNNAASAAASKISTLKVKSVKSGRIAGRKSAAAKKPTCIKEKTMALPVKEIGVKDQLPGDKEANELLIAKAEDDIKHNKARIIKESVLQDSYKQVAKALDVQDEFHQWQAKVLRETLIPGDPKN